MIIRKLLSLFLILFLACSSLWAGVDFDNVDDVLSCGSNTVLDNPFDGAGGTFAAWVFIEGDGESATLGGYIAHKTIIWFVRYINDASPNNQIFNFAYLWSSSTGTWRCPSAGISLNAWNHVAVTYDADVKTNVPALYINGVSQTVTTIAQPTGGARNDDAAGNFEIGNRLSDTARTFNGKIDDVALWKGVILTAAEISLIASSKTRMLPLQIQPSFLSGYWKLDDCSDGAACTGTFRDMTANANTCTPSNNPTGVAGAVLSYP